MVGNSPRYFTLTVASYTAESWLSSVVDSAKSNVIVSVIDIVKSKLSCVIDTAKSELSGVVDTVDQSLGVLLTPLGHDSAASLTLPSQYS